MNMRQFWESLNLDEKAELTNIVTSVKRSAELHKQLTNTEQLLIYRGEKIQAIKEIRNRTGLGLRDSKEVVDKFIEFEDLHSHLLNISRKRGW